MILVQMVHKAILEHKVILVYKEEQDQMDLKEDKVQSDHKVDKEGKDQSDLQDLMEVMDQMDHKVHKELLETIQT